MFDLGQGARPAVPDTPAPSAAACPLLSGSWGLVPEYKAEAQGIPADRAVWGDQSDSDKDHRYS